MDNTRVQRVSSYLISQETVVSLICDPFQNVRESEKVEEVHISVRGSIVSLARYAGWLGKYK